MYTRVLFGLLKKSLLAKLCLVCTVTSVFFFLTWWFVIVLRSLSYTGGGKGSCRFCGTTSNTGLLAIGNVCMDPECQERAGMVCDKTLPCGHTCCGVKEEEKCLPCLLGCTSEDPKLKQDADDMCMICYTEGLSCAPCIQVTIIPLNPKGEGMEVGGRGWKLEEGGSPTLLSNPNLLKVSIMHADCEFL